MNTKLTMLGNLVLALAFPLGATASVESLLVTDSQWNTSQNKSFGLTSTCWTNAAGESCSWDAAGGADTLCILEGFPGNVGMTGVWEMNGLRINQKYVTGTKKCLFDSTATYRIGAGGVESLSGSVWFANGATDKIVLTADQTWRGSSSSVTQIGVGRYTSTGTHLQTRIAPESSVTRWDIEGNLCVWLTSPSNDFRAVDVTVSSPAKLFLINNADAVLRARKLTLVGDGERLPLGKSTSYTDWSGFARTTICALDSVHLASALELKDGADLVPASAAVFDIPTISATGAVGSRSEVTGTIVFSRTTTAVEIAEGVTLAFAGVNRVADGIAAGIDLSGSGTLELASGLNGAITVAAGSTLKLTGAGKGVASIAGAGSLVVAASGTNYLGGCDLSGYTGERIDVTSGTLELGSMAVLAAGVKIRTSGDAKVLFGTTDGFDESRLEGTKAYVVDPWLVTDAVRKEATLTVGAGDVLRVRGNGLTVNTALTLNGGTVYFEVNGATIGSAVSVVARSYFETAANSVTGCVSGVLTASIPSTASVKGVRITGPGCVDLTGGGSFSGNQNSLYVMNGASVRLRMGTFDFPNASLITEATSSNWGRYIGILDGASVTLSGGERSAIVLAAQLDGSAYSKTAVFEVGSGATCALKGNLHVAMGSNQAQGKVVVDGGTLKVGGCILLGYADMGTGIVDMRAGTLELSNPMRRYRSEKNSYQGQGRIDWSGGTIRLSSSFPAGESYLIRNAHSAEDALKRLRVWTRIMGDCTLDLSALPARESPLANVPAGFDRAEWFGKGTLTVKGGKPFVMNSIGDGVGLRLADDNTQVVLPEDAQVFDYDICAANMNVVPYKDRYSTTNTVLTNLAMPTFAIAGEGVCLTNGRSARTISISEALVEAGGCLDTTNTLVGAGAYAVSNLTFAHGSALRFPFFGPMSAFEIEGVLTLPDGGTLNYDVDELGARIQTLPIAIVKASSVSGVPTAYDYVGEHRAIGKNGIFSLTESAINFRYRKRGLLVRVR